MRPLRWGDGTRWGDINARWGSPSYVLELGDVGYVHPGPTGNPISPKTQTHIMKSSNETPRNSKALTAVADDINAGMTTLQDVIGLHHHRTTTVHPAILKLEGDPAAAVGSNANKGSQLVFRACTDVLGATTAAMMALSNGAVKTLLGGYRKVLEGVHGRTWNTGWEAAGFTNHTTAVPENHDERLALLAAMRAYLAANAAFEATLPQPPPAPPLAITDAAAQALHTQFLTARNLVNATQANQELCKNLRNADVDALYKEVSGSITEIRGLLSAEDTRWEAFGLNIPAHPTLPEGATGLTLSAAGPGKLLASWNHARRATAYRVLVKVLGVDADFHAVDRVQDLELTLKGLTTGATVAVEIAASNETGDAAPGSVVQAVVG